METENNQLTLCGVIRTAPALDHEIFGEKFYRMELSVPRLSGTEDILPITLSERQINSQLVPGVRIGIVGQLRSYNKAVENSTRLLVTAFALQLVAPSDIANPNAVQISGALCKPPAYRTTPFGREITDLMLAVNRSFGKSDYIPCIAWGRTARYAAGLQVGARVTVQGRFQSRSYQKQLTDGTIISRVAYELSLNRLSLQTETAPPQYSVPYTPVQEAAPDVQPSAEENVPSMPKEEN